MYKFYLIFLFVLFNQTFPRPLPSFATDFSEVAISAVIERGALAENKLHLSVFMVVMKENFGMRTFDFKLKFRDNIR